MTTALKNVFLVLLADDDADDSMLFANAANEVDIQIQLSHADNGQQLLKFLDDRKKPDIIFLDLNMPLKNGFECLKIIRSKPEFEEVPVIIYSTSSDKKDIDICYKERANFYVVKPYSYSGIVDMLKKICTMYVEEQPLAPTREHFVMRFPKEK